MLRVVHRTASRWTHAATVGAVVVLLLLASSLRPASADLDQRSGQRLDVASGHLAITPAPRRAALDVEVRLLWGPISDHGDAAPDRQRIPAEAIRGWRVRGRVRVVPRSSRGPPNS